MNTTKIFKCKCEHDYQDKKYGKNNRIHNKTIKYPGTGKGYRCTICNDIKEED